MKDKHFIMDKKGLSPVIGLAFVLIILSMLYIYYQVYAVPQICSNVEVKHFADVTNQFIEFSKNVRWAIATGKNSDYYFRLGRMYPEVPFFSTLHGFSGSLSTYPAEVRIVNAIAVDEELRDVWDGREIVYSGVSLRYVPRTMYSDLGSIYWEYGVVAIGKTAFFPMGSFKPIKGKTITIPLLMGNLSYSGDSVYGELYIYSGGGGSIEVEDNGNPITIYLRSSLPLEFWKELLSTEPYISSVSEETIGDTAYIKIELAKGYHYKLTLGAVSFEDIGRAPPHYLYRITPKASKVPAELAVEVRDLYNNPAPNVEVTFSSLNGSTTLTDGTSSGTTVSTKSTSLGIASVVATEAKGSDTIVASITRKDGSPYEIAFLVVG